MRIGVALTGLVSVALLTLGVVWFVRDRPIETKVIPQTGGTNEGLEVSKTGPWPKANLDKTEFDFGRVEVGEEGKHDFVIRNDGEAPLKVKKGPTTCQCTVSEVKEGEIAPGASVTVTLPWKPTAPTDMFDKGATIFTNDPENEKIQLKIVGMVTRRLAVMPENTWPLPDMKESEPTTFVGKIGSTLDEKFEVVKIECDNPFVTAEAVPLDEEKIAEARVMLSGYDIKVSVEPRMPVGSFAIPLKIKTDLLEKTTKKPIDIDVTLTGYRRGPLRMIGKEWVEDRAAIVLGAFDAAEGKKVDLSLLIKGAPAEGLVFSDVTTDPKALQVKIEKDEKFTGSTVRFHFSVEYPAGSLRESRRDENPGSIKVKTNHPEAPEMEFTVFFSAF